jgi:hypothetical protein
MANAFPECASDDPVKARRASPLLKKSLSLQNKEISKMEVAAPCPPGFDETMIERFARFSFCALRKAHINRTGRK